MGTTVHTITPHDTTANEFDAIYVAVTGHVKLAGMGQPVADAVLLSNVPVGLHQIRTGFIMSTGTTATGLVGIRNV